MHAHAALRRSRPAIAGEQGSRSRDTCLATYAPSYLEYSLPTHFLTAPLLPDCLADPNPDPNLADPSPDPNLADLPHGAHVQLPGARFPQAEPEPEPEP